MNVGRKCWEVEVCGPGSSCIQGFAFAEDLDLICVGNGDGIQLLDAKNGSSRGQRELRGGVTMLVYSSPDLHC